ncbi:hypothetical protein VT84_37030 [Gemmata sp. SH-PL17]|uniref:tail completion protein gp17 n=1 Tax=Gemmata sp. SH-PL17 TaxID=1630693 RepID=UPI00078D7BBE|nr:DUF3168 domain-containing protein [Gemmata sp. SH-PL17]AMV30057.1 hypothetical protein VT84_37030 [Gemmata sp. SH-PL17]
MPAPANWGEALAQRLLNDTAVGALVGTKVYPSKPTQDTTGAYVVYFRAGGADVTTLGARSALQPHDVRVECYADTQADADALLVAVVTALCGNKATGVAPWRDRANGVQGCFTQGDGDELVTDDAQPRQVSGQTFRLFFKPPT